MAVDELFSNIARYAYAPGTGSRHRARGGARGPARRRAHLYRQRRRPTTRSRARTPNTGAPIGGARAPGGLGVYIVKKTMDAMSYERADGRNILRVKKFI